MNASQDSLRPEYKRYGIPGGLWSKFLFSWVGSFINGRRRDFWIVGRQQEAEALSKRLKGPLKHQLALDRKHAVVLAILECFRWEIIIAGVLEVLGNVFAAVAPFLLRFLVKAYSDTLDPSTSQAYSSQSMNIAGLIFTMSISHLISGLLLNLSMYKMEMVAAQAKTALVGLVLEKSMVIMPEAENLGLSPRHAPEGQNHHVFSNEKAGPVAQDPGEQVAGHIFSLVSVEVSRIGGSLPYVNSLWTGPVTWVFTATALVLNLESSAILGLAVILGSIPMFVGIAKLVTTKHRAIRAISRQRVSLTREIFRCIKCVKASGWEQRFATQLTKMRQTEIESVRRLWALQALFTFASMSLPSLASLVSLVAYSLSHNLMDPARIFASIALFNGMKGPVTMITSGITRLQGATVASEILQRYLSREEEKDSVPVTELRGAVDMTDATFAWASQPGEGDVAGSEAVVKDRTHERARAGVETPPYGIYSFQDIPLRKVTARFALKANLIIGREELVAIIGGVGSGKSSFLSAVAGQMALVNGHVAARASKALSPQLPWIQSTTVLDNITLGHLCEDRYCEVINACALKPDLATFAKGDHTQVGERGTSLSGGQSQRISLARAVYQAADITLLDDALSSVDPRVARHIFDKAICGLLRGKCRLIVTNQPWALAQCDRVLWLERGTVRAFDTYANISSIEGFEKLVKRGSKEAVPASKFIDVAGDNPSLPPPESRIGGVGRHRTSHIIHEGSGTAPWQSYKAYFEFGGGSGPWLKSLALLVTWLATANFSVLWLSLWSSNTMRLSKVTYILVYVSSSLGEAMIAFIFGIYLAKTATTANRTLWNASVCRVLQAPVIFFQKSIGEVLDRFSKDTDTMDNELLDSVKFSLVYTGKSMGCIFLMLFIRYDLVAVLAPAVAAVVCLAMYYQPTAREAKHRETSLRAELHANLSEALSGLSCIKVYGLQKQTKRQIYHCLDEYNNLQFFTIAQQRWLAIRLDMITIWGFLVTSTLGATAQGQQTTSAMGLLLSQALLLPSMLRYSLRHLARLENAMVATQRLVSYATCLEKEEQKQNAKIRDSWPEKGEIVLQNVYARHQGSRSPVLQDISLHVQGGEHIAIVGRTGAGKSSLASLIIRLLDLESGSISIDGVTTEEIRLHDLRARISTIPQDPSTFAGSLRSNLDPFGKHSDAEILEVIGQLNALTDSANQTSHMFDLDEHLLEGGLNYSDGRKQILAIGRALLQKAQVSVFDEAMSSLGLETDIKITRKLRNTLRGKTVICITHRAEAAIRYDKICVLHQGRAQVYGDPLTVYDAGGFFQNACNSCGIMRDDIVRVQLETTGG